jgi:hypothetical protein
VATTYRCPGCGTSEGFAARSDMAGRHADKRRPSNAALTAHPGNATFPIGRTAPRNRGVLFRRAAAGQADERQQGEREDEEGFARRGHA